MGHRYSAGQTWFGCFERRGRILEQYDERSEQAQTGIEKVTTALNMEGVLPRIAAPTLVITADRSALQSVEAPLHYQKKIPNARLVVLLSDAYHLAVAKADECVTNALAFIKQAGQQA